MKAILLFITILFGYQCPSHLVVNNYSDCKSLDSLSLIILDKIFRYDSITITIVNMQVKENTIASGFIDKDSTMLHSYIIYVNTNSVKSLNDKIYFICHELSHLRQYESGELVTLKDKTGMIFRGDTINFESTGYSNRPYELDAIAKSIIIQKELKEL